jgi:LytS/YehU family sensor histidine kinase
LIQTGLLQKRELSIKNNLLVEAIIALLLVIVIAVLVNRSIRFKKKEEEAYFRQKIAETQMLALRSQMNPHFIFNSLNSIENFIMKDEKIQASDYLNKFSKFIRNILDSSHEGLVPFASDIEAMQLYIDLEQLRYNNKFSYLTNIDPALLNGDYHVPSLLVQPYLENAIVHGIVHSDKPGLYLILSAFLEIDCIKYIIEDNGIGRKQASAYNMQNKPHHISAGLQITEDRVHIFNQTTGGNTNVEIVDLVDDDNVPSGTRVVIKIKAV